MSLRKISSRSIVTRLVVSTFSLLLVSLFLVSTVIYYLFATRLRESDKELLSRLGRNYAITYQSRGVEALKAEISPDIMFQVVNAKNEIIFSKMPQYIDGDFEDDEEIQQMGEGAARVPLKEGLHTVILLSGEENIDSFHRLEHKLRVFAWENNWQTFLPLIDNDLVEVLVVRLSPDRWLRIGRSAEIREEQLADIRYIAGVVFLPFLFVGIVLSFLLARKILKPIRELAGTIEKVKAGDMTVRAVSHESGDEVDLLTREFNALLDRNLALIENLQTTVNNIAHDLRTPMTRFRVSAETALLSNDAEKLKDALAEGVENSERILKILNAIMDVAEADAGTMKVSGTVNLRTVIHSVVDMYSIVAEEKHIQLTNEVQHDVFVTGNEARLMQVFGNLIDNAFKYTSSNVLVSAGLQNGKVTIRIKDDGRGIPSHEQEKIWNKLYRGDASRNTSGLGLGLSLVKAIIEAHGGAVGLTCEDNKGCVFSVTLPTCNEPVRVL